jgi:CelD/BcsL family acetyltransferase involved in cellulose biosynthesis
MNTAAIHTDLQVREVREEEAFELLKEPWNALATGVSASIFMRHEWFSAAWAWRRGDATLCMLCVYSAETLVGVFPLIQPRKSFHGGRLLEFLSVPDTQCCDLLADPACAQEICKALVAHLASTSSAWDQLRLERLPPHSLTETTLQPLLAERMVNSRLEANDCNLFIDLEGPWEDYYATRSRSFKKAFNLAANRLARTGGFKVETLSSNGVDRQRMQRFLDEIVSISARSWKRSTGNTLDVPGPRAFIERLTDHAYTSDWLSVWVLRIHDTPVAMEYQIVYDHQVHALRADFDDEYKNLSPGSYLSHRLVEGLFANGFKRYYMGPGKNSYKTRWSKTGDMLHTLTAYAPTLRGRAVALWPNDVKPKLRTLRDRLSPVVATYFWLSANASDFQPLLSII